MRLAIRFLVNGRPTEAVVDPHETLLDLLRGPLGLAGTKEGCGEGDCGACTVVLGEPRDGRVRYRAVTSCLVLAAQVEGRLVITVEGLARGADLHPIQQAVLDHHATQCGFCTPGVEMSLLGLFLEDARPDREALRAALEGNLCRCTGYFTLREAGLGLLDALADGGVLRGRLRPAWLDDAERALLAWPDAAPRALGNDGERSYQAPADAAGLRAAVRALDGRVVFLNGGTDVVVAIRKRGARLDHLVDLGRVAGLDAITVGADAVEVGGTARLSDVADACRDAVPVLADAIRQMCSRPVRTLATLAGNVANASPIADTVPVLMALDATLVLDGPDGERTVPIARFFQGYKRMDRRPGEWVRAVRIPRPDGRFCDFRKASKRRELDISSVNSAICLDLDGRRVRAARLALGGVAPTTILSGAAETLVGRDFTLAAAREAGEAAAAAVAPIGDVRGSAEFRRTLVRNLVVAHWLACARDRGWDAEEVPE